MKAPLPTFTGFLACLLLLTGGLGQPLQALTEVYYDSVLDTVEIVDADAGDINDDIIISMGADGLYVHNAAAANTVVAQSGVEQVDAQTARVPASLLPDVVGIMVNTLAGNDVVTLDGSTLDLNIGRACDILIALGSGTNLVRLTGNIEPQGSFALDGPVELTGNTALEASLSEFEGSINSATGTNYTLSCTGEIILEGRVGNVRALGSFTAITPGETVWLMGNDLIVQSLIDLSTVHLVLDSPESGGGHLNLLRTANSGEIRLGPTVRSRTAGEQLLWIHCESGTIIFGGDVGTPDGLGGGWLAELVYQSAASLTQMLLGNEVIAARIALLSNLQIAGGVTLENTVTENLIGVSGSISGTGGLTKEGAGTLTLFGAGTYTGTTRIESGTVIIRNSTALGATGAGNRTTIVGAAVLEMQRGDGVVVAEGIDLENITGSVSIRSGQGSNVLNTALGVLGIQCTAGSLTLIAPVDVDGGVLQLNTSSGASILIDSGIGGQGAVSSSGAGSVELNGNCSFNGGVTVSGGTLAINGPFNSGAVVTGGTLLVNSTLPGSATVSGGTLSGTGTVGSDVFLQGTGTLTAGSSAGRLTVQRLTVSSASAALLFEINGPNAESGYDVIEVVTDVTLTNSPQLLFTGSYGGGTEFLLLEKIDGDAISGAFAGLAEGATIPDFMGTGLTAQLTYEGGNGNDLAVSLPGVNQLQVFRAINSLPQNGSQDNDAPAGDGVPNIVKFASNVTDISVPLADNVDPADGESGLPHWEKLPNGNYRLTYVSPREDVQASGINLLVTGAADLGNAFQDLDLLGPGDSISSQTENISDHFMRVTLEFSPAPGEFYYRLEVTEDIGVGI